MLKIIISLQILQKLFKYYYVKFHTAQCRNENIYGLIDVQCVPNVIVSLKNLLYKTLLENKPMYD